MHAAHVREFVHATPCVTHASERTVRRAAASELDLLLFKSCLCTGERESAELNRPWPPRVLSDLTRLELEITQAQFEVRRIDRPSKYKVK